MPGKSNQGRGGVAAYLRALSPDRRTAIAAVRSTILANLDRNYEEGMSYGMIGYAVPHRVFPAGYHCNPALPLPFAGLASQKGHMSIYLMSAYGDKAEEAWLRQRFAKAGKKLDMGRCCIRFKRLEDLPLDVIGEAIRRVPAKAYIERYIKVLEGMGKWPPRTAGAVPPRDKGHGARSRADGEGAGARSGRGSRSSISSPGASPRKVEVEGRLAQTRTAGSASSRGSASRATGSRSGSGQRPGAVSAKGRRTGAPARAKAARAAATRCS